MFKYTFILSTGRTGTLFLYNLFNSMDSKILSVHEPHPSYHLRILSNIHSHGYISDKVLLWVLLNSRKKILKNLKNRSYIEANNFIYGFINVLKFIKPAPALVHIVRDPREYIRSYLNHGAWSGKKRLAAQTIPYWQPNINKYFKKSNQQISPITRFAAVWTHINRFLLENGKTYPNYLFIRFEDIFEPPYSGLESLLSKIGVSYQNKIFDLVDQKINTGNQNLAQKWTSWSNDQCQVVANICGDLMNNWGYGNESEWRERLKKAD